MRLEKLFLRNLPIGIVTTAILSVGGISVGAILGEGNQSPQLPQHPGVPSKYIPIHEQAGPGHNGNEAAALVLAGMRGTYVRSISVGSSITNNGNPGSTAPWVSVDVSDPNPDSLESHWLGSLAQGAVADLMRTNSLTTQDVIGGGQVTGIDHSGNHVSSELGTGFVLGGQQFQSLSDTALKSHVSDVAAQFGLQVRSLFIIHPLDSAISVSFIVPDNITPSWTIDQLRDALDGTPKGLEGSFIQLYSSSGNLLLSSTVAYRTGLGGLSFAPGQDARFGAVHGNLAQP